MDSIEKMRRLNELTKELKQHGFAESSFEAIQQANQIYGPDEVTNEVRHGLILESKNKMQETQDEIKVPNNFDKKIAKIEENVDTLANKMNEIIKAINDMDQRLHQVKDKQVAHDHESQQRLSEQSAVNAPQQQQEVHANAPSENVQQQVPPKKDEYSTNQRTGSYQPTDVAIDKMFYYGKK